MGTEKQMNELKKKIKNLCEYGEYEKMGKLVLENLHSSEAIDLFYQVMSYIMWEERNTYDSLIIQALPKLSKEKKKKIWFFVKGALGC